MQRNCLQLFQFFLKKISQQKGLETSAFIYMVVIMNTSTKFPVLRQFLAHEVDIVSGVGKG